MHNEIYRIAYTLNQQGKTPSVALVRAKLSRPTSLPVIVQALQQWKQDPGLGEALDEDSDQSQSIDDSAPEQNIEQRVNALEAKVEHLMQLLKQKKPGA